MNSKKNTELNILALRKFRLIIQSAQDHSNQIKLKTGISGSQIWLLQEISDKPNMTVGELAREMSLKSTTISNLLEAVESLNLVNRLKDENDKRRVLLQITTKGKSVLKKSPKPTKGLLPQILLELESSTLINLNKSLDEIISRINNIHSDSQFKPLPFTR